MAETTIPDSQASISVIPETQQDEDQLDREIATIKAQIHSLTHRRSLLTASLLTTSPSLLPLSHAPKPHPQHRLHRLCTGATTFPLHDPDPHAQPAPPLLGIRIEAFAHRRFLAPYYLLLSRPYPDPALVRIHRHTVPPYVPLAALAAKYLPAPRGAGAAKGAKAQDLVRLVREVRREIVGEEMRRGAVERVRGGVVGKGVGVRDVVGEDAGGREVRIEWKDGAVGRVRVGKEGRVEKVVVLGEGGRAREVERRLLGGDGRVEGLVERLREVERLL